jgi:hypothetical protein
LLTFIEPFEYVCGATFRLAVTDGPHSGPYPADVDAQLASFRTQLLDYAWHQRTDGMVVAGSGVHWFVDAPAAGLLRLCLTTSDPEADTQHLRQLAQGYLAEVAARTGAARANPSEAEAMLSQFAAELQARLNETRAKVEESVASLPESDPRQRRDALLSRWRVLQEEFLQARDDLARASAELARLEAEPEPTHGIVSHEDRNEALSADTALQQDLRELEVNLTELKLHLLNVWQESAGELEHLGIAADELLATHAPGSDQLDGRSRATERAAGFSPRGRSQPDRLEGRTHKLAGGSAEEVAGRYRELLDTFSNAWNRDFAAFRRLEVDPLSSDMLTIHQRLRSALNDFLFSSSTYLAALRAGVVTLGAGAEDRAQLHVFESNVVRSFQAVQTAHRRFEFAAAAIETRDNFRLDTALRSARGLRRRSQQRIKGIDERLQREAQQHAREQRDEALAVARKKIEGLRSAAGQVVEDLVTLQTELNLSVDVSEDFLRSALRAELTEHQAGTTRADLAKTEGRLQDLVDRRTSAFDDVTIELVDCGVIAGPVNLGQRLRIGGIGALATLLVVGIGQWWLNRRQ